jgi:hypothetical protein
MYFEALALLAVVTCISECFSYIVVKNLQNEKNKS